VSEGEFKKRSALFSDMYKKIATCVREVVGTLSSNWSLVSLSSLCCFQGFRGKVQGQEDRPLWLTNALGVKVPPYRNRNVRNSCCCNRATVRPPVASILSEELRITKDHLSTFPDEH